MPNLSQGFDCEISDRFMSCEVKNDYLNISIGDYGKSSCMSISFDQVVNLIEYLEKVKGELVGSIAPQLKRN